MNNMLQKEQFMWYLKNKKVTFLFKVTFFVGERQ